MKLLEINKVTAARKMFNDAVLLFYERRSPISIHHLAHAVHEVLCTLTGDSRMLDLVAQTPDEKKEFKRAFNTSKNYIKHADKDPDATLAFNTEMNILILFDCAWVIALHIDNKCVYSQTVIAWCAFVYPDLFDPERIKQIHNSIKVTFDLHDFDAIAADLKLHYHA
ncbi:MAG: hypothetical protein ACYCQI_04500 [Gammaproteobacteria bacterium]